MADDFLDPRNTPPPNTPGPIGFLRPPSPATPEDFLDPRNISQQSGGIPSQGYAGYPEALKPSLATLLSTGGAALGGPVGGGLARLAGAEVGPGMEALLAARRAAGSSVPRLAAIVDAAKAAATNPLTWARAGGAGAGAAAGSALTGESPSEQLGRFGGGAVGEAGAKIVGEPALGAVSDVASKIPFLRKLSGAPFAAGLSDADKAAAQYAASITQPSDVWKLSASERVFGQNLGAPTGSPVLTPHQIHPESAVLGMVEGMAERSFAGAPILESNRLRMGDAVAANVTKLVGGLTNNGTDKQVTAEMLTDAATGANKFFKKYTSWVYDDAIQRADAAGALVPNADVKAEAARLWAQLPVVFQGIGESKLYGDLKRIALDNSRGWTFATAQKVRSTLLDAARGPSGSPEFKLLAGKVGAAMDDAADAAGPDIKLGWHNANQLYSQAFGDATDTRAAGRFTGKLMESALAHADERTIVDGLFNGPASGMAQARGIVGDDTWKGATGWKLRDLIDIDPDTQRPNWTRTQRNLLSWGADGRLEAAIPDPAERQALMTAVNVGSRSEKSAKMPMASMAWSFLQAGTALAVIGLRPDRVGATGSMAILLSPAGLAKAMTNPSIARWLTIGTNAAPGTFSAMRATAGLMSQLTTQGFFARGDAKLQGDQGAMNEYLNNPSGREGPPLSTIQQHDAINKQQ